MILKLQYCSVLTFSRFCWFSARGLSINILFQAFSWEAKIQKSACLRCFFERCIRWLAIPVSAVWWNEEGSQNHLIATWKGINVMQTDVDVLLVSEPQRNDSPQDDFEALLRSRDARHGAEGIFICDLNHLFKRWAKRFRVARNLSTCAFNVVGH